MNNSNEENRQTDLTGWTDLTELFYNATVQKFTELIGDGLTNGFEFKLQGSHIYYRERTE